MRCAILAYVLKVRDLRYRRLKSYWLIEISNFTKECIGRLAIALVVYFYEKVDVSSSHHISKTETINLIVFIFHQMERVGISRENKKEKVDLDFHSYEICYRSEGQREAMYYLTSEFIWLAEQRLSGTAERTIVRTT